MIVVQATCVFDVNQKRLAHLDEVCTYSTGPFYSGMAIAVDTSFFSVVKDITVFAVRGCNVFSVSQPSDVAGCVWSVEKQGTAGVCEFGNVEAVKADVCVPCCHRFYGFINVFDIEDVVAAVLK